MAWNPMRDAISRWQSASPADQNWYVSRGYGPGGQSEDLDANISPWGRYNRVLDFRGAQLNPSANPAEPGLPAGYTEGQLDTENAEHLTGGARPRWAASQNLPGSQRRIASSMQALQGLLKRR